jgi:hypothetical protein
LPLRYIQSDVEAAEDNENKRQPLGCANERPEFLVPRPYLADFVFSY